MNKHNTYIEKILTKLPAELAGAISMILNRMQSEPLKASVAAFDLDWTLLNGDVAESAYLHLLSIGHRFPMTWQDYINMLDEGKCGEAFVGMVESMAGLNVRSLYNSCDYAINHPDSIIRYEIGTEIIELPAPSINRTMYELIAILKLAGFRITVISASPHYAVRYVTTKYFGLNPQYCYGIRVALDVDDNYNEFLASEVIPPVTWGVGKTEVLRKIAGDLPIMLVAGDSEGDVPMMNMLADDGLAIIRQSPMTNIEGISEQLKPQYLRIII